ncbi:MAG: hypothetical protein WAL30_00595 [Candidatus Aquirickettsiella sp.]
MTKVKPKKPSFHSDRFRLYAGRSLLEKCDKSLVQTILDLIEELAAVNTEEANKACVMDKTLCRYVDGTHEIPNIDYFEPAAPLFSMLYGGISILVVFPFFSASVISIIIAPVIAFIIAAAAVAIIIYPIGFFREHLANADFRATKKVAGELKTHYQQAEEILRKNYNYCGNGVCSDKNQYSGGKKSNSFFSGPVRPANEESPDNVSQSHSSRIK